MIDEVVGNYLRSFPKDPTHPFLANFLERWKLTAWSVVLGDQGYLMSHIHLSGRLSGVYYVESPDVVVTSGERREGWLEVGRLPPELPCKRESEARMVQPEEGMMVLFPSYFYHRTVPIETTQRRICIAFDVQPGD